MKKINNLSTKFISKWDSNLDWNLKLAKAEKWNKPMFSNQQKVTKKSSLQYKIWWQGIFEKLKLTKKRNKKFCKYW